MCRLHSGGSAWLSRRRDLKAALAALVLSLPALAQTPPAPSGAPRESSGAAQPELAKRFADWLEEVTPLITAPERALFLKLNKDYQRDAFIRRFWQVRDPYPETARNELRERWDERVAFARSNFGSLADARAQILLVHGEPARRIEVRCTTTRVPAEIWLYTHSPNFDFRVVVVFLRNRAGLGLASVWFPGRSGAAENVLSTAEGCMNAALLRDVLASLGSEGDYELRLQRVLSKPLPRSMEWVATFAALTTDLPAQAELLDADLTIDYLGRHQSRTVLQGVVALDVTQARLADFAGYRSYDFQLIGEVIVDGQLLESFRYKFGFPVSGIAVSEGRLPMPFQRFVRPGHCNLIVRVEDLNSHHFYRQEIGLDVPQLENKFEVPPPTDPEIAALFEEASQAISAEDVAIRLVPPSGDLQRGLVRFDTVVVGDGIDRVAFFLDDKEILRKNDAPYNVELDLGEFPRLHTLRAEAVDAADAVLAEDEIVVNAGAHQFLVRLVEPRRGQGYSASVRARVEVEVPEAHTLDRVELFVNETPAATLYQEPFVQPLRLPGPGQVTYVRAVAYLTDGNATEDLVFINAPNVVEEVEVQFVELFAAVTDRSGRPITDLLTGDFSVEEDGVEQKIARFERVSDLPIHVGVLIDNSASMRDALETTREAALSFFKQAITPRDRAAVITFNRFPNVAVKLTNNVTDLGGGLAGLTAEGQTALYDSLMFSLYYFTGISGQRAILVLSDGKDEVSRFTFEETLEYARRAGVTVYTIGLGIQEGTSRRRLTELAEETGGASHFIHVVDELGIIYQRIQEELRSQYLIAYQSGNTKTEGKFRRIELKAKRPGAVVKTMSGYYP